VKDIGYFHVGFGLVLFGLFMSALAPQSLIISKSSYGIYAEKLHVHAWLNSR